MRASRRFRDMYRSASRCVGRFHVDNKCLEQNRCSVTSARVAASARAGGAPRPGDPNESATNYPELSLTEESDGWRWRARSVQPDARACRNALQRGSYRGIPLQRVAAVWLMHSH